VENKNQADFFKRILFFFVIPFCLILTFDVLTKIWAQNFFGVSVFGFIQLSFVKNYGAVLGLYSEVPKFIFIVTLSTAATLLFCIALALLYFLPRNLIALPIGISFLISGIIGNALDRIQNGYVTDFISFHFGNIMSPYLNVADFVQWVAYLFLFYAFTFGAKKIWRMDENRSKLLINKSFQLRFCISFILASLAVISVLGIFSYTFIKYTVMTYGTAVQQLDQNILKPFLITFFSTVLIVILIIGFFSLIMSHRIAGPIYAFERTLRLALSGTKGQSLHLREKDAFKDCLEPLAKDLAKALE
jgi:signal peptidase II